MDVISDDNEVDLSHIKDAKQKAETEEIIEKYQQNKGRDLDIKMRIILNDEAPVCQRPRRLSPSEKQEVDTQIEA